MVAKLRLFSLSLSCLLLLQVTPLAFSAEQSIVVKSSVDKTKVSVAEPINFKIEITGDLKNDAKLELPDLKNNFEIISTAQSQSLSIRGKEKNRQITFIYVLAAKSEGKFTIKEVLVKIGKDIFKTQSIDIEVTPSLRPRLTPQKTPPNLRPESEEESQQEEVIL